MSFKSFLKQINQIADKPYKKTPTKKGVIIYNKKKVQKGNRFYNGILIDVEGKVLKKYSFKYLGIFHKNYYLAQKEYELNTWGLFTKNNELIWKKSNTIHHDIQITPNNTIITFDKETKKYKGRKVDFDTIVEYDFKGKKLQEYSIYDNLKEFQKYHKKLTLDFPKLPLLPEFAKRKEKSPWGGYYDYYHINSIQIILKNKSKDKRFQQGNWLISFRHGSLIYILDKDTKEIVYSLNQHSFKDQIQGQHGPQILENGNMLIFDNGRYRKWSRVIEINPVTLEIVWEYSENIFTEAQGFAQRLKNENTLITLSELGRVIEVTKDKEIVWEFNNPKIQNDSRFPKWQGKIEWIYRMTHYD